MIISRTIVPFLAAVSFSAVSTSGAANLLFDPGFEGTLTYDGAPFVGSWEGFNGGGATAVVSPTLPRSGVQSLHLDITNTDFTFAGAFQDVAGLTAGSAVNFNGYFVTTSSPFDVGAEIRIEWRNSGSNTEVARTPNLTPVPGSAYSMFDLATQVPAGADTARLVFAIQSFGPGATNSGNLYVDDVSFTVVPEPAAALTGGLAALGLMLRRRRA